MLTLILSEILEKCKGPEYLCKPPLKYTALSSPLVMLRFCQQVASCRASTFVIGRSFIYPVYGKECVSICLQLLPLYSLTQSTWSVSTYCPGCRSLCRRVLKKQHFFLTIWKRREDPQSSTALWRRHRWREQRRNQVSYN